MTRTLRVSVFGGPALMDAVATLGHEICETGQIAVIDVSDDAALRRAAALDPEVPRVVVAPVQQHAMLRAVGASTERLVARAEPAILGPVIASLDVKPARAPTRVVIITGTSGGVGASLLATNLARRLSRRVRVAVVDATGSGASGWWLNAAGSPWTDLEGLAQELSADHVPVIARETPSGVQLIGGPAQAPSDPLVTAAVRAATAVFELVIVDAPPVFTSTTRCLQSLADRILLLIGDVPALDVMSENVSDRMWIIASRSRHTRLLERDVTASVPRDDASIAAAIARRSPAGGAIGRAYDDLAELLFVDRTR